MKRRPPARGGRRALRAFLAGCPPGLRRTAHRVLAQRPPCLLCGAASQDLGLFVPHSPQAWGTPAGWQAGCVYMLCRPCAARPDREAQVEAVLWRARAQAVARWN